MNLKFLDQKTRLDIKLVVDDVVTDHMLCGSFFDTSDGISILIEGPEFYSYCETAVRGFIMEISFISKMIYSFRARFTGFTEEKGTDLVKVTAISEIKEIPRRALPRLEIALPAQLSVKEEGEKPEAHECLTVDITITSVRVITNFNNETSKENAAFKVIFSLGRDEFTMSVRPLRKIKNPPGSAFRFDYVFLIDYEENKSLKEKLLLKLFEFRRLGG
ncbi:MAG: hypothetical protein FWE82_03325 [Defluviitaleaceae bacterium]|nr:hypothetical protein [Defluviitaleaceae bacterium]